MTPLLWWGLPGSEHDNLLFGGDPPWSADRYNVESDLERLRGRDAGADTDLNPLTEHERVIDLTADDKARAEILRRYRLYSRQPDEMIIFRALQQMNPRQRDFDPKLYQYGGAYIYLIGATLGVGAVLGLVQLTGDVGFYLEHPEAFARFFIAARFVSLVFGAFTLIAVGKLARRAGGRRTAWIALLCVAFSPVFITGVLEAKPHLPSACMILWAVLSGLDYHAHGRRRAALRMGWQVGCAFGLVLTGCLAALMWPVLLLTRPRAARRRTLLDLLAAAGIALGVYAVTNPYVLINADARASNLRNSTAMYEDQMSQVPAGAVRVGQLLLESTGPGVLICGVIGLALLFRRHRREMALGAVTGLAMLLMCVLLAAGKPVEFARFLILPVLLLAVSTGWLLHTLAHARPLLGIIAIIIILGVIPTSSYVRSFVVDTRGQTESRALAGTYLHEHMSPEDVVGLLQEPAPYAVPPLDFTRRRVLLLPAECPPDFDETRLPGWLVFTADDDTVHRDAWWHRFYELTVRYPPEHAALSPISWADKPVFVYRRKS
ncbi:MAG: glycosyltransferase family 39 protein [Phycisphaerae bacterium]|nr:glycosyltransferase family 39 protein [Phycisphaerae bacterium]